MTVLLLTRGYGNWKLVEWTEGKLMQQELNFCDKCPGMPSMTMYIAT